MVRQHCQFEFSELNLTFHFTNLNLCEICDLYPDYANVQYTQNKTYTNIHQDIIIYQQMSLFILFDQTHSLRSALKCQSDESLNLIDSIYIKNKCIFTV